jgi:phosphatidyl-myo-inositol dimannoside synthase
MKHLLVTNDFPPKVGGIQAQLWELWRRLTPEDVTVLTTPYEGDSEFDRQQAFRVVRTKQKWLLPTAGLVRQINELAEEVGAELVVLDPALPLGLVGPKLNRPYVVFAHGAEFVIPARLPVLRTLLAKVVNGAVAMVGSGNYVSQAMKNVASSPDKEVCVVPPGVDVTRFVPLDEAKRREVRKKWGIGDDEVFVFGVSRLVPRKGFDRLIKGAANLSGVRCLIAGKGRQGKQLQKLIDKTVSPTRLLGRVADEDLVELHGAADIFVMPCHDRWFGLEQEGFGIVFIEASSTATPVIGGVSGGSVEAITHGATGLVVAAPVTSAAIGAAIKELAASKEQRGRLGAAGRARMEAEFDYEVLSRRLGDFLSHLISR